MQEPTDVDLGLADPSLAGAPLAVRKADAWLKATAKSRALTMVVGTVLPIVVVGGPAILHDVAGLPDPAMVAMMLGGVAGWGALVGWASWKWGRTAAWAATVMKSYRELKVLGPDAPEVSGEGPIDRMAARIGALAGDRPGVAEAAAAAAARARRIEAELAHLARSATGDPRADSALDAARQALQGELDHLKASVAETYAALAELDARSGPPTLDLEDAVGRLAAELEVDRGALARRARAAAAAREGGQTG